MLTFKADMALQQLDIMDSVRQAINWKLGRALAIRRHDMLDSDQSCEHGTSMLIADMETYLNTDIPKHISTPQSLRSIYDCLNSVKFWSHNDLPCGNVGKQGG